MGNIFRLPIVHHQSLAAMLATVNGMGIRTIAADAHGTTLEISQASFTGPVCIVLGSEGSGISGEVLAHCAESVRIPMREGFDSFNVACASAVFLYEVERQRRGLQW
jgi:23S rRNA (guanosine2251-2'-O)-methyltransferase